MRAMNNEQDEGTTGNLGEQRPSEIVDDLMKELKQPKEAKGTFLHIPLDKKERKKRWRKPWRFFKK